MNKSTEKRGHVIVVDDDREIREMVSNYFEERSLPTLTAPDQRALRRLLTYGNPRLILLDLRLGETDGFDLLRSIRSHSDVPIIVITGRHVEKTDQVSGLEFWRRRLYYQAIWSRRAVGAKSAQFYADGSLWISRRRQIDRHGDIDLVAGCSTGWIKHSQAPRTQTSN